MRRDKIASVRRIQLPLKLSFFGRKNWKLIFSAFIPHGSKEKICLTYFELCQTYFKIQGTYFLPSENPFENHAEKADKSGLRFCKCFCCAQVGAGGLCVVACCAAVGGGRFFIAGCGAHVRGRCFLPARSNALTPVAPTPPRARRTRAWRESRTR